MNGRFTTWTRVRLGAGVGDGLASGTGAQAATSNPTRLSAWIAALRMLRFVRGHWRDVVGAALAVLVVSAINLVTPQLIRFGVDVGIGQGRDDVMVEVVVSLLLLGILRALL